MGYNRLPFIFVLSVLSAWVTDSGYASETGTRSPEADGYKPYKKYRLKNFFSLDQLRSAMVASEKGLKIRFKKEMTLLDGSAVQKNNIYGTVCFGPYPFESKETSVHHKRLRKCRPVNKGEGRLDLDYLLRSGVNSEGWSETGSALVRFHLFLQHPKKDRRLGFYDVLVRFAKSKTGIRRLPAVSEGPFMYYKSPMATGPVFLHLKTDLPAKVQVQCNSKTYGDQHKKTEHVFELKGLLPAKTYAYSLLVDGLKIPGNYRLQTAPAPGTGTVRFGYMGDSREGVGYGEQSFMGLNAQVLQMMIVQASLKKSDFIIFGGDLVDGATNNKTDFEMQLYAWKQVMAPFWHSHPVYQCMGNHETLLNVFQDGSAMGIRLDKWPYASSSAEAVFANMFYNPDNGPKTSQPFRPGYKRNVFSFQYGPVFIIAFNNNYWYSSHPHRYGGAPEGYLFDDQLNWIYSQLKNAQNNSSVHHILLFAQEPVLPSGGHLNDAMWYGGDNRVRAYVFEAGVSKPKPYKKGIIDVRNQFLRMVSKTSKVRAVLGADEHAYYRFPLHHKVPVGIPEKDDKNGDGILCQEKEPCSPLADLQYPFWVITSGGAGAPYYSVQQTPWNNYFTQDKSRTGQFKYSSQENWVQFEASPKAMSMAVYNKFGEIIDRIEDLTRVP